MGSTQSWNTEISPISLGHFGPIYFSFTMYACCWMEYQSSYGCVGVFVRELNPIPLTVDAVGTIAGNLCP